MKPTQVLTKFLEARDTAHLLHLNTTSYAEHKALDTFYNDWLGLVDTFVETYAGRYQRIEGVTSITIPAVKADEYLKTLRAFVQIEAASIIAPTLDADLANILADMLALINHTLYMLTLK